MQQSIFKATTRTTLRQMRPHWVKLISTKNRKKSSPNLQELTKIGQLKTGKMLPGLLSHDFC